VLLILLVLGTILLGIASPTEAAAFGAGGALVIGILNRRLTWQIVYSSAYETLSITAMVGWTMIGATAFGSVFSGVGGNMLIANLAMNMPGGPSMVLLASAIFFFILGMFLEPGAIIFFAVPIVAPILARLGYDPLWVGLAFNVLLQCGYLSPPFGFSLFYLKGVAPPDVTILDIYKASVPFIGLQFVCILIIFFFPSLILWFPRLVLGL
jgi:tripartite ATP-independent transporter DctM subunit